MNDRKPFALYAITTHGIGIAARLLEALPEADLYVSQKLLERSAGDGASAPVADGPDPRSGRSTNTTAISSSSASVLSYG